MKTLLVLLLLLLPSTALAAYRTTYNPFVRNFDYVGVDASADVTLVCDLGLILKSDGAGAWSCQSDATGAGANISVLEDSVLGSASIASLDFQTAFDTTIMTNRARVSLDLSEVTATMGTLPVAGGGTGITATSNDAVLVGNNAGTGYDRPALPNCTDSGGQHINYTTATGVFSCGTTGDGSGTGVFPMISEDGTAIVSASVVDYTTGLKATGVGTIVTVSGDMSTTTTPGIASFDATDFTVRAFGGVSLNTVSVAKGGTNRVSVSNDAVLVGNNGGTGYDQPALPNCTDVGGNHLNYTTSTGVFTCGTTGDGGAGAPVFPIISEDGTNLVSASAVDYTTGLKATNSGTIVTVSGDMATTTTPGIASFDTTDFTVRAFGGVSLNTVGVVKGGTGLVAVSDDAVLVGNNAGTGYNQPALPSCSNGTTSKLLYNSSTGVFTCGTDQDSGGSTVWSSIGDAAAQGTIAFADFSQFISANTNDVTALTQEVLSISITNDALTDLLRQRVLVLENESATGGTTETMLAIDNQDNSTVTTGIQILGSSTGSIKTAVDLTDAELETAVSAGGNIVSFDTGGWLSIGDGASLDMSGVNANTANEGFFLPRVTSLANISTDGQMVWRTSEDVLYVGTSTLTRPIGILIFGIVDPTTQTNSFGCAPSGDCATETTTADAIMRWPQTGIIRNLRADVQTAPAGTAGWTCRIEVGGSLGNTQCTIFGSATSCQDLASTDTIVAGQTLGLNCTETGAATGTTVFGYSAEFIPSSAAQN